MYFGNEVQDMRLEEALGEAVRFRRRAIGLNQEELAERAGLQKAAVSRVERGDGSPNLRTISRVAAALDICVSQLMLQAEALLPVMEQAARPDPITHLTKQAGDSVRAASSAARTVATKTKKPG